MQSAATAVTADTTPDPNTPCTLFLYLDLSTTQGTTNGLFANNTAANPSKVWQIAVQGVTQYVSDGDLTVPLSNNNNIQVMLTFNMNGGSFTDTTGLPGPMLNGSGTLSQSALRVTIQVARNRRKSNSKSIFASPFALLNSNSARAIFDGNVAAASLPGQNPSATAPMGVPTLNSGSGNGQKDCYIFLVSITANITQANGNGLFITDSHDPEIEIGM